MPPLQSAFAWATSLGPLMTNVSPNSKATGPIRWSSKVEEHIVRSAAEIAFTYGLRAYDSLQLAAARYFHEQSGEPLTFACFDKRLNAAARSSGLKLLVH